MFCIQPEAYKRPSACFSVSVLLTLIFFVWLIRLQQSKKNYIFTSSVTCRITRQRSQVNSRIRESSNCWHNCTKNTTTIELIDPMSSGRYQTNNFWTINVLKIIYWLRARNEFHVDWKSRSFFASSLRRHILSFVWTFLLLCFFLKILICLEVKWIKLLCHYATLDRCMLIEQTVQFQCVYPPIIAALALPRCQLQE